MDMATVGQHNKHSSHSDQGSGRGEQESSDGGARVECGRVERGSVARVVARRSSTSPCAPRLCDAITDTYTSHNAGTFNATHNQQPYTFPSC